MDSRYEILTPNGFRSFYNVMKKPGEIIKIWFVDKQIECSKDHRFENEGKEIVANTLKVGDKINGETIIKIEDKGKGEVYTPVMVDGHKYLSKGLINYNCSFLGSSLTLIDGKALEKLISREPIRTDFGHKLKIFEEPIPGALYVMGVDSSTGVGNDSCTIQVIKINHKDSFEQTAVFSQDKIKPEEFAVIINEISLMYNDALMILENNDVGRLVAEYLWYEIGCGNVINTDKGGGIGTRATPQTKLNAIMMLRKIVESGKLKIYDKDTIHQLSRFEEVAPKVFRGAKNQHDDLVSSLYWAVYCLNQPQIDLDSVKPVEMDEDEFAPPPVLFDESSNYSDFWKGMN